jgi:hypothetical protein
VRLLSLREGLVKDACGRVTQGGCGVDLPAGSGGGGALHTTVLAVIPAPGAAIGVQICAVIVFFVVALAVKRHCR